MDAINPQHYKNHPSGIECIQVIYPFRFDEANAMKYMWRLGFKDEDIQELEKAAWYLKHAMDTGIVTDDNMVTYDSVEAFKLWYYHEPESKRKDAISRVYEGDLVEALETIYAWIAEIKGVQTWEVTTPNPQIGT